jgi:hypothetical protein
VDGALALGPLKTPAAIDRYHCRRSSSNSSTTTCAAATTRSSSPDATAACTGAPTSNAGSGDPPPTVTHEQEPPRPCRHALPRPSAHPQDLAHRGRSPGGRLSEATWPPATGRPGDLQPRHPDRRAAPGRRPTSPLGANCSHTGRPDHTSNSVALTRGADNRNQKWSPAGSADAPKMLPP